MAALSLHARSTALRGIAVVTPPPGHEHQQQQGWRQPEHAHSQRWGGYHHAALPAARGARGACRAPPAECAPRAHRHRTRRPRRRGYGCGCADPASQLTGLGATSPSTAGTCPISESTGSTFAQSWDTASRLPGGLGSVAEAVPWAKNTGTRATRRHATPRQARQQPTTRTHRGANVPAWTGAWARTGPSVGSTWRIPVPSGGPDGTRDSGS